MKFSSIIPMGWTLARWRKAYSESASPATLIKNLHKTLKKIDASASENCWISLATTEQINTQLNALEQLLHTHQGKIAELPLYGIPFAVKDNIDARGFETTAACPSFAYTPTEDAFVVKQLKDLGAIVMGKTNLDQFATGLVGTRSPYGKGKNPFHENYISGGSSSGSAIAVARGYVPFALGTDTAGSGRIPAGFNHIVGLKPSKGLLSTRGVVPACKSLDCVSIFALNTQDAQQLLNFAQGFDREDPFSRTAPAANANKPIKTLGIPKNSSWFEDEQQERSYLSALETAKELGYTLKEIDFAPLFEIASLLYQGPWVAERYAAVGKFIEKNTPDLDATVKQIITGGVQGVNGQNLGTAADLFHAEYKLKRLMRDVDSIFTLVDALFVPTAPCFPTVQAIVNEPILVNSRLGTYTNFVNLADLCAIAVPSNSRSDGLPFGITIITPAFNESALLNIAHQWQAQLALPSAPTLLGDAKDEQVDIAVVGAHLTGMPLNHQLTTRGAQLVEQTKTSADYRLYALAGTIPPKPGLTRVNKDGQEILVEIWRMNSKAFGEFTKEVPRPLGIGNLTLIDGREVKGFICEGQAIDNATDITAFGGWRAYIQHNASQGK